MASVIDMDWKEDNMTVETPTLGGRILSVRYGRFKVTGTIHTWWLNDEQTAAWRNLNTNMAAGGTSNVYHHLTGFQRFDILITSTNPSSPVTSGTLIKNVVFKDLAIKFVHSGLVERTATFEAESVVAP